MALHADCLHYVSATGEGLSRSAKNMKLIPIIISTSLASAFAGWIGWIVTTALRSGVARIAGGKEFKRKKSPFTYWIIVFFQLCFTLMFLTVGLIRLSELWK